MSRPDGCPDPMSSLSLMRPLQPHNSRLSNRQKAIDQEIQTLALDAVCWTRLSRSWSKAIRMTTCRIAGWSKWSWPSWSKLLSHGVGRRRDAQRVAGRPVANLFHLIGRYMQEFEEFLVLSRCGLFKLRCQRCICSSLKPAARIISTHFCFVSIRYLLKRLVAPSSRVMAR